KQVLLIGAGALGAANAEALVRMGIGKLTIADRDYVEWSNLQRQQLYTEEDAKQCKPKAIAFLLFFFVLFHLFQKTILVLNIALA
ncbi:ThiF family adenylyltransferase, partial [Escherichia coli]